MRLLEAAGGLLGRKEELLVALPCGLTLFTGRPLLLIRTLFLFFFGPTETSDFRFVPANRPVRLRLPSEGTQEHLQRFAPFSPDESSIQALPLFFELVAARRLSAAIG